VWDFQFQQTKSAMKSLLFFPFLSTQLSETCGEKWNVSVLESVRQWITDRVLPWVCCVFQLTDRAGRLHFFVEFFFETRSYN
jgi:hypothetical protein